VIKAQMREVAKRPRLAISIALVPLLAVLIAGAILAVGRRRAHLVKVMRRATPAIAHRRRRVVQGMRRRFGQLQRGRPGGSDRTADRSEHPAHSAS
jgi:hypothetical protein